MMMERYVEQLIENLRTAHRLEEIYMPSEFEENNDYTTTMVQLTGIGTVVFPPVEKLSDPQLQNLSEELIALIESYNYIINLPKRLPANMVYQKLLSKWSADIPIVPHGLSALGWLFCEEEDPETCSMREWCDWLKCEIVPETVPIYDGIYDDDGNKIEIRDIPIPDLCLTCAKFLIDDWDENILCDLTRADEREEGEEFMCYAWARKRERWE